MLIGWLCFGYLGWLASTAFWLHQEGKL